MEIEGCIGSNDFITFKFSIINEKIKSNKSKINLQKEEILKTENLIGKFEEVLSQQSNMLKTLENELQMFQEKSKPNKVENLSAESLRISELNERSNSTKYKINLQKEEKLKTENLIDKFHEILSQQSDMLQTLENELQVMFQEKIKLKTLNDTRQVDDLSVNQFRVDSNAARCQIEHGDCTLENCTDSSDSTNLKRKHPPDSEMETSQSTSSESLASSDLSQEIRDGWISKAERKRIKLSRNMQNASLHRFPAIGQPIVPQSAQVEPEPVPPPCRDAGKSLPSFEDAEALSPCDGITIKFVTFSRKFYARVAKTSIPSSEPFTRRNYPNQTLIPNTMKVLTSDREMVIVKLNLPGERTVADIVDHRPVIAGLGRTEVEAVVLHFTSTAVGLSLDGRCVAEPTQMRSIEIRFGCSDVFNRVVLQPETLPASLAVELVKHTTTPVPELVEPACWVPSLRPLPDAAVEKCASFIKLDLSPEQVLEHVVFLAAEFAIDFHKQGCPVGVVLADCAGAVLLSTSITPRRRMVHYRINMGALQPYDLLGQTDEYEALRAIRCLLRGRILVGCDLARAARALRIHLNELLGLRDICYDPCVARALNHRPNSEYSLRYLAKRLVYRTIAPAPRPGVEEVNLIREVYLKLHSKWQDEWLLFQPASPFREPGPEEPASAASPQQRQGGAALVQPVPDPDELVSTENHLEIDPDSPVSVGDVAEVNPDDVIELDSSPVHVDDVAEPEQSCAPVSPDDVIELDSSPVQVNDVAQLEQLQSPVGTEHQSSDDASSKDGVDQSLSDSDCDLVDGASSIDMLKIIAQDLVRQLKELDESQ